MLTRVATPERPVAFCDGVFAVLITVLVLDLRPPQVPRYAALPGLWPLATTCMSVSELAPEPVSFYAAAVFLLRPTFSTSVAISTNSMLGRTP